MSQAKIQVKLEIKEIYEILCGKCKKKLKKMIKDKIAEKMANSVLGEK